MMVSDNTKEVLSSITILRQASSDVWACAIDPSAPGGAAVVDAYNTPGYNSVRDTVQVGN